MERSDKNLTLLQKGALQKTFAFLCMHLLHLLLLFFLII